MHKVPRSDAAIQALFPAIRILREVSNRFRLIRGLAAFIQRRKDQIRAHRLLHRDRVGIMAVFDIGQITPQLFQHSRWRLSKCFSLLGAEQATAILQAIRGFSQVRIQR